MATAPPETSETSESPIAGGETPAADAQNTNVAPIPIPIPSPSPSPSPSPKLAVDAPNPSQPVVPPQAQAEAQVQVPKTDKPLSATPEGLSNAELKRRAKEEKAARRAKVKEEKGLPRDAQPGPSPSHSAQGPSADGRPAGSRAGKAKQQPQQPHAHPGGKAPSKPTADLPVVPVASPSAEAKPSVPGRFSHLPISKSRGFIHADKDVNSAMLLLGQHMSTFALREATSRTEATLLVFKKILHEYETPQNNAISRHFISHVLSPQIVYLTACRPMCFAMGNAVRWLKQQTSKVDPDMSEDEAKEQLYQLIDAFIRERISLAAVVIARIAAEMINDDDKIVTFGHHSLVERTVRKAVDDGKRFRLVVVDSPLDPSGKEFAKRMAALADGALDVTYVGDFGSLGWALGGAASRLMVAPEGMFSNGSMYGRAGTCDVALAAAAQAVELVVLCETINFTDRLALDSLAHNEIGRETEEGFSLLFDTTKHSHISSVVTELGVVPPTAAASLMKRIEKL